MKIGFIGLGVMGRPMALNLLKAGFALVVHNRSRGAVEELVRASAEDGGSPRGVMERSDVLITMLPNSPDVESVLCGPEGAFTGFSAGKVIIDMSSIDPGTARSLAARAEERGGAMLDAPVSGGEEKARSGKLSIMAGGPEAVFEKMRPVFQPMGNGIYVGESGAGQVAKLVNQTIVAVNIAAVAEGLTLARRAGVDPVRVFEALRGGLAGSQCLEDKAPRMFEERYQPGFRLSLHAKDLTNALNAGREYHSPLPLTAQVMGMVQSLLSQGCGGLDHAALARFYETAAGLQQEKP